MIAHFRPIDGRWGHPLCDSRPLRLGGRVFFRHFRGFYRASPLFCGGNRSARQLKLCPCAVFAVQGHFCAASGLIAADGRRSERRKARARPPCAHAGGLPPPSALEPDHQTTGATAARRRGRAHTARQAERARQRREGDRQRQRGCKGARPARNRLRPTGAGHESAPPCPRLNFRSGVSRHAANTTGGRGERPVGAAGEGGHAPAKQSSCAPPHRRPNAAHPPTQAPVGGPRARREDAKATRQPVTRTQTGARPAAKPPRPPTRRRPAGAGATAPPPRAPETARPRQRTAARRRGGRRRRGRAALGRTGQPPPLPPAQSAPLSRECSAADADGRKPAHGAQAGGTAAGSSGPKGAEQTPLPRAQRGAKPSGRAGGPAAERGDGRERRRAGEVLPSDGCAALSPAFYGHR